MVESTLEYGSRLMPLPSLKPTDAETTPHIPDHHPRDDSLQRGEYTRRHREAWPVMIQGPDAESLVPAELSSWLRLWGRLGAELFRCFREGDGFIRSDMIALARTTGGWRGELIAARADVG